MLRVAALCALGARADVVPFNVDYASFLARADPVWRFANTSARTPTEWVDSLFGGSGDTGFHAFMPTPTSLRVVLGRASLWDDRTADLGLPYHLGNFVYDTPRLPIGALVVEWPSPATRVDARLSLFRARVEINITTAAGAFSVAAWAPAVVDVAAGGADVVVVELAPGAGAAAPRASFVPDIAQSTWSGRDARYVPNPAPLNSSAPAGRGTLNVTTQPHLPQKGTAHATAVLAVPAADGTATTFYLAVSPVLAGGAAAAAAASAQVAAAAAAGAALRAAHEAKWAAFWPAGGFVSVDDSPLEANFYIQLYKFASAVREGGGVHDLEGPWFIAGTDWPDAHWDMNLQQTYYLPLLANRPGLSSTLTDYIERVAASGAFTRNVPPAFVGAAAAPTGASSLDALETCYWSYGANCTTSPPSVTGNLMWVLSLVHLNALYSANATVDVSVIFPLLTQAIKFYSYFENVHADGSVHLAPTFSPEYPGSVGADANYDLALLRWGLSLGLELAAAHNLTAPAVWAPTLAALAPPSVDPATNTLEIYASVPYKTPHRHYSHLFSIWPLRSLDVDGNATARAIARASINLWLATPEEDSMFYRPAASAMNVLLGQNAAAFDNISDVLHHRVEGSGWYREGAAGSCTETPYHAAWAVADWLLQSWRRTAQGEPVFDFYPGIDDVIALTTPYTAAPARVSNATFYRLGTEGGALASAARGFISENATHVVSRTSWIAVEPRAGQASAVVRTSLARPLASAPAGAAFDELGGGAVRVTFAGAGGAAIFSAAAPPAAIAVTAAAGCAAQFNHFGVSDAAPVGAGPRVVLRPCVFGADGRAAPAQRYALTAGGRLALGDGSGRCLSAASAAGAEGDAAVLVPCVADAAGAPRACDPAFAGGAAAAQTWAVTSPADVPPSALVNAAGGRCLEVNGAFDPDTIDVYDCADVPGGYKNEEWAFNATSGAITTLDSYAPLVGLCLTPAA